MSEKSPQNSSESIPVLVKRGGGKIDVMNLTNEMDEYGRTWVEGQTEEEIDGERGIPAKPIAAQHLTPEYQAQLAEELAMSRNQSLTELDRGVAEILEPEVAPEIEVQYETRKDIGEVALHASDIARPSESLGRESDNAAEVLATSKQEYDRQIDGVLEAVREDSLAAIGRIEQSIEDSSRVLNRALAEAEDASRAIRSVVNKVEYDGYTAADVRTTLDRQQLIAHLNSMRNAVRAEVHEVTLLEDSIEPLHQTNREAIDLLASREEQFEAFLNETITEKGDELTRPDYSTDKKRTEVHAIDQDVDALLSAAKPLMELATKYADDIGQVITHLDLINETIIRHGHVDTSELLGIASKLQSISEGEGARRIVPGLLESAGQLRQHIYQLGEA